MFEIPYNKKIRVIIDTDAACEADDPFAIVHALLSPKLIVKGIVATHFNEMDSTKRSFDEINTILSAMKLEVPVYMGQTGSLADYPEEESPAVKFIAEEANREEDLSLFILCQGAITNVAMALRKHPEIKNRLTIVWIGTHGREDAYCGWREFNAGNDVEAANEVLTSGANIWLIPSEVYTSVKIGLAEIEAKVAPYGEIGRHLYENMVTYNLSDKAGWTRGESWSLGDSPAIALAINEGAGRFINAHAPHINDDTTTAFPEDTPMIRVYTSIDSRYVLDDFFAKLRLSYPRQKADKWDRFLKNFGEFTADFK